MPERLPEVGGDTAEAREAERQARPARDTEAGTEAGSLLEAALRRENLRAAHARVVRNAGAPGVDGMTVDALATHCREHWPRIREELLSGRYVPSPVRKVQIPKPGGRGRRTLGIPTVMDRLIQQALLQVLTPIFDPTFSDASFGFRPGRGAHDAVVSPGNFRLRSGGDRPRMRLRQPPAPLPVGQLRPGETLRGSVTWDASTDGEVRVNDEVDTRRGRQLHKGDVVSVERPQGVQRATVA